MAAHILIPAGGIYRVLLDNVQSAAHRVTVPASSVYQVICDGLVSDKQLVNLTGRVGITVSTSVSQVAAELVLQPAQSDALYIVTSKTDLEVVRELASELLIKAGSTGDITVERVLDGSENSIGISTLSGVLSGSVYTLVSEWTEDLLSELESMSLDEMIYKEV